MHARTWLSLYKSIKKGIIEEICIHKSNLPNFYQIDVLCIFPMQLHNAPRAVTRTDF